MSRRQPWSPFYVNVFDKRKKRGDMTLPMLEPYYERDGVTIYHGDCLEVLPQLPKLGSVITDPPYGINTKSDGDGKLNPWADLCNAALWYRSWFAACRDRLTRTGVMWSFLNWRSLVTYQKAACDLSWPIESLLVWHKQAIGPGGPRGLRPSYELVALWAMPEFSIEDRGLPDVQTFKWSGHKQHHPAEKPLPLMRWLARTARDGILCDPFCGSGTALVAAKQEGLEAIGIEIDERYCEVAAKRLAQRPLPFHQPQRVP